MKIKLTCTLLLLLFVQIAFAQVNSNMEPRKKRVVDYRTAAYFYPFAAISDNFRIALEQRSNEKIGLRGVFNYGFGEDPFFMNIGNNNNDFNGFNNAGHIDEFTSFSGEFQLRYYPMQGNPSIYTAAFAGGRTIDLIVSDWVFSDQFGNPVYSVHEQSARAFGFGVIGGMQFQIAKVFLLDAYIGAGPNIPSGEYKVNDRGIAGFRKGMRYNGGLNFGVILFK